jgi:seryl-tRNA synthetase
MLDIKDIRKNPDRYKKDLARKGVEASVIDALLEADQKHREALQKTEEYKRAQNEASKKDPNPFRRRKIHPAPRDEDDIRSEKKGRV